MGGKKILDELDELRFHPIDVFKHCYFRTYLVLLYSVSAFCRWRCMCVFMCALFGFFSQAECKQRSKTRTSLTVVLTVFRRINWVPGLWVKAIKVKIQLLNTRSKFIQTLACNNSWQWCVGFFYMYFNLITSSDGIVLLIAASEI